MTEQEDDVRCSKLVVAIVGCNLISAIVLAVRMFAASPADMESRCGVRGGCPPITQKSRGLMLVEK